MPTTDTIGKIQRSDSPALSDTVPMSATTDQPSLLTSTLPSSDLSLRWQTPGNVQQFASQVNAVATKVLNGEIDSSVARTYATLARVVAQALAVEVMRARLAKTPANLSLNK